MPRAYDPSMVGKVAIKLDRDPTQRISYQVPDKIQTTTPPAQVVDLWTPFVNDFLIPIIHDLTGIDLFAEDTFGGDIREILTGIPDADDADLGTWVLNFFNNPLGTLFPSAIPQLDPTKVDTASGNPGETLWDDLTKTWNDFWDAIFGTSGSTGKTPADMGAAAGHITGRVDAAQFSTETLAGFFNQPRVLPAYEGALSDEMAFAKDGVDGTSTPALGTLVLIPVKIKQDRTVDALKIGCAATTMTNLYIGLYDCDETTGDLAKVLDLGDRKADLDLAFVQQTFELDEAVGVQRGEVYFIGVLQVGGTAAGLHRKSLTFNVTDGSFPKYLGSTWATTGIAALPATITDADVLSGTRYWGAIGTAIEPVAPGSIHVSDSFTRPDSPSSPGPGWTVRSGSGGISGNKPLASFGSHMVATYNTRLSGSSQRVGFHQDVTATADMSVSLRGNGLGPCVELLSHNSQPGGGSPNVHSVHIYTRTSYDHLFSAGTVRASFIGGTLATATAGDWVFDAVGDTYTGYLNGVAKLQWIDSGGAFTVASNSTEVGFYTNDSVAPSTFDDWFAQDA